RCRPIRDTTVCSPTTGRTLRFCTVLVWCTSITARCSGQCSPAPPMACLDTEGRLRRSRRCCTFIPTSRGPRRCTCGSA
ncbi:hypothetical protein AAFF_G00259350, partial [Aldrovandia affinis]